MELITGSNGFKHIKRKRSILVSKKQYTEALKLNGIDDILTSIKEQSSSRAASARRRSSPTKKVASEGLDLKQA